MAILVFVLFLLGPLFAVGREKALLFISITSGSRHENLRESIRSTWISVCKSSPDCDYRFFVDTDEEGNDELKRENAISKDMVFRSACPYMKERHPSHVNYGNGHVFSALEVAEGGMTLADYPLRRM